MTDTLTQILKAADAGERVEDIAVVISMSPDKVYRLLRVHRPDRPRSPHRTVNETRMRIEGMLQMGHEPPRVAKVIGVSRQYVYRIASEVLLSSTSNIAKPWHNQG